MDSPRTPDAALVLKAFRREMPGMPTADYAVLPMALLFQVELVLEAAVARLQSTDPSLSPDQEDARE